MSSEHQTRLYQWPEGRVVRMLEARRKRTRMDEQMVCKVKCGEIFGRPTDGVGCGL